MRERAGASVGARKNERFAPDEGNRKQTDGMKLYTKVKSTQYAMGTQVRFCSEKKHCLTSLYREMVDNKSKTLAWVNFVGKPSIANQGIFI